MMTKNKSFEEIFADRTANMTYVEFLQLVRVVRMLYGVEVAKSFFEKNLDSYLK